MLTLIRDILDLVPLAGAVWLCWRLGFFPVALGETAAFGGLTAAAASAAGAGWGLSVAAAAAVAAGWTVLINMGVLYPLVRRGDRMTQALVGLGAAACVAAVGGLVFGTEARTIRLAWPAGGLLPGEWIVTMACVAAVLIVDGAGLGRDRLGLYLRASGDNPVLAELRGLRPGLAATIASAAAGAWAGVGGANAAALANVRVGAGLSGLLLAFAAVLVAGHRSIWLVYATATAIALLQHVLSRVAPAWQASVLTLAVAAAAAWARAAAASALTAAARR